MISSKLVIGYLLTAVVFFALDMFWLGFLAKGFYQKHLGNFLSSEVNWKAAIIFYLLFIVGIFIFAILPAIERNSILRAVVLGGLFGFFTYATYDLTNLATMRDWPMRVVIVDIIWGVVLTGLVSTAGFKIMTWLNS
jgi:uncharacterized membrane protein